MRLLCESIFIRIDRWTLIQKMIETGFSHETKASILFILTRRKCLWCPILKRKEIIMWICICPNRQMNINSKNSRRRSFFLWNQSINIIYPNKENVVRVPNHERKRLLFEFVFVLVDKWTLFLKNGLKRSLSYETKASIQRKMRLWCPMLKRKENITWISVYPN